MHLLKLYGRHGLNLSSNVLVGSEIPTVRPYCKIDFLEGGNYVFGMRANDKIRINCVKIRTLAYSKPQEYSKEIKQATGVPPIEYLQHIRIEKAKKQLEQTNLNISEIINETGYTDPKSFRKVFLKLVGMTASEYRNKLGIK